MSLLDTAKAHPIATGGIVIGGVILIYVLLHAGSKGSGEIDASAPSSAVYGSGLVQATNSSADTLAQMNLAAATNVQLAAMSAATDQLQINRAADVASLQINRDADSTDLQSSLAAQIAGKQIDVDVTKTLADFSNQQNIAQINANVANTAAAFNAQTTQAAISADVTKSMSSDLTARYLADVSAAMNDSNNNLASTIQGSNERIANLGYASTNYQAELNAGVQQSQIASNERVAANTNYANATIAQLQYFAATSR